MNLERKLFGRRVVGTTTMLLGTFMLSCSGDSGYKPPTGGVVSNAGAASTMGGSGGAVGSTAGASTSGGTVASAGMAGASFGGDSVGGSTTSAGSSGMPGAGAGGVGPGPGGAAGAAGAGGSGGVIATGGTGGTTPGKVVLFDGKNLDAWQSLKTGAAVPWRLLTAESAVEVIPGTGNIVTKQKFEDLFVHVEYWTPMYPSSVTGQSRGNSGVYLKRAYEMQVLDTFGLATANDSCGAVYGTRAPLVSACFQQEVWNTYEIEFKSSVWNAQGTMKTAQAVMVSATLNGQLVQQNVPLTIDPTPSGVADAAGPQPLMLQDHDPQGRVRFRNIWVIPR